MKFLKEYWLWILGPIVLVFGLVIALAIWSNSNSAEDGDQPFIYNIW